MNIITINSQAINNGIGSVDSGVALATNAKEVEGKDQETNITADNLVKEAEEEGKRPEAAQDLQRK